MCGICGYIDPEGVCPETIEAMKEALAHRGPDGEGTFLDQTVALGHRRLAIIDLEAGRQPMSDTSGRYVITFNGEIYNYRELRKELAERYRFATKSDTEVILNLYRRDGVEGIKKLRGMFAFALYDRKRGTLVAARDHFGQKPFYYALSGGKFYFASEIKAILAAAPHLRKLNRQALYEYLTVRIITPPRSMFSGVRKLPPGHYLVYENGTLKVEPFWDLYYEPKVRLSFKEALEELDRRVQETVSYHLVSDVPVGAFLSGGMDSSLVVAVMSRFAEPGFPAFTGEVPYQKYSELPYAAEVAERYGVTHHPLTIRPSLIETLPELVWHLDEPSDALAVCLYALSELIRRHVKVVLGGDGGDELFGGYDRYYGNLYVSYYELLPEAVRRHICSRLLKLVPEGFWYRSASHRLRWIHELSFFKGGERYAKSLSYFYVSDRFKQMLYTERFLKEVGAFDPEAAIRTYFERDNARELIDRMLYADSRLRMVDHPVMVLDRMTMAHGLEARAPFLDPKLAEFCASLPPVYKVRGRRLRYIQTRLAERYLPPRVVAKKKQGFASALPYMLAGEFRTLYTLFLRDSHLVRDGILRADGIKKLLQEHESRKADHGNRLWLLCNAEVWYRMQMEEEPAETLREALVATHKSLTAA